MNKKVRIEKIAVLVLILLAVSIITVFAAGDAASDSEKSERSSFWTSIWDILTDEQKNQLADEAQEKLEQSLEEGRISQEQYDNALDAIDKGEIPYFSCIRRGGRMMMKKEHIAATEELRSRWYALTDEQKEGIYDLNDQKAAIDKQIIDEYEKLGIIDAETAQSMRSALESQKNEMRTNGRMPVIGNRGMRFKRIPAGG